MLKNISYFACICQQIAGTKYHSILCIRNNKLGKNYLYPLHQKYCSVEYGEIRLEIT